MRFRVGDRVIIAHEMEQSGNYLQLGWQLTILGIEGSSYCCKFDERYMRDFHDLDGRCEWGYGYYCSIKRIDKSAKLLYETPDWEL